MAPTESSAAQLTSLSAHELATRIAAGDVSSVEVVEAHIARIEQVNPALNAVVVKRYDTARAEARQADERRKQGAPLGPLHGVPITIKEVLDLEGTPSTFGIPSRAKLMAAQDDTYVARIRKAGAIVLGKTNVAQMLLYLESDNPVYGRTNNPWNLDRTAGGTSGGECAIIASGGSPLGLGTDIGGSLRAPPSFCAVVSFRPTAGRAPDAARFSVPYGERAIVSQVGAIARDVADVAQAIQIVGEPAIPLGEPSSVDISKLRIAYYTFDGTMQPSVGVRRAVTEAADMLRQAGAMVTEWRPPDASAAVDLFYAVLSADGGAGFKRLLGRDKQDPRVTTILRVGGLPRPIINVLRGALMLAGQNGLAATMRGFGYQSASHYFGVVEALMDYQQRFADALDRADGGPFDVILCPPCPLPAFTHGSSGMIGTAGGYAVLYNVLGYPTGVVPIMRVRPGEETASRSTRDIVEKTAHQIEVGSAGLPVGVQVAARPWRDHVGLAAMQAIQAAARKTTEYPTTPILPSPPAPLPVGEG